MGAMSSVDEILDFAIGQEEEAARFYTDLAQRIAKPGMRKVFEGFAREELGHKAKLVAVKDGRLLVPAAEKVMDLKIADYLTEVEASPGMRYQDILVLAMKREKAAFKMYSDLAATTEDQGLRDTFLALAQEEAKHKLRFEIEYDEQVLAED
jgi:rubrerythrin